MPANSSRQSYDVLGAPHFGIRSMIFKGKWSSSAVKPIKILIFISLFFDPSNIYAQVACPVATFSTPTLYSPGGEGPSAIVIADFNGDKKPDIAVSNSFFPYNIGVLLGKGEGTFETAKGYASGGETPYDLATGDFNRDGNVDLVTANFWSGSLAVLLGKGNGTFEEARINYVPGGLTVRSVKVGDFNGDGKDDVVTINRNGGTAVIFLGKGDGTFDTGTTYNSGWYGLSHVAIGDFNGDKKQDLAVSNNSAGHIAILLGYGDGSFGEPKMMYAEAPEYVVATDLNADGKTDLAVIGYHLATIIGHGDGTFEDAVTYYGPSVGGSLAVADYNGDGMVDIAMASAGFGNAVIRLGKNSAFFGEEQHVYIGSEWTLAITAGDLNNDGKVDLASANYYGQNISVVLNNCTSDIDLDGDPNETDCAPTDKTRHHGAPEIVDNEIDEDCDGYDLKTWYEDKDKDGFGNPSISKTGNQKPDGFVIDKTDCNDSDAIEHPGQKWFVDKDGDGIPGGIYEQCTRPEGGQVLATPPTLLDCNDNNPLFTEPKRYYADFDGDGFGRFYFYILTCATPPPGFVDNGNDCDDIRKTYLDSDGDGYGSSVLVPCGGVARTGDCNDGDATIYPGAPEITDGKDNNCNGKIDENTMPVTWYRDRDGDGFGDPKTFVNGPVKSEGYVSNKLDCNDYKVFYEDKDNDGWGSGVKVPCGLIVRTGDCDDNNNKVHSLQTFYRDADGDSYGDASTKIMLCTSIAPAGYVKNSIDCNDGDKKVYWPKAYYRDADGDGLGDPQNMITVCSSMPPAGYVANAKDNNDTPLIVSTQAGGAKTKSTEATSADNFKLAAFPNPFAGQTRIQYAVPVRATVSIKVFDVVGREVGAIYSGERTAGNYVAEYTTSKLSAGVYYLRLVATVNGTSYVQSQKLIKAD